MHNNSKSMEKISTMICATMVRACARIAHEYAQLEYSHAKDEHNTLHGIGKSMHKISTSQYTTIVLACTRLAQESA